MKNLFFFFLLLIPSVLFAQFTDDFSDGDFTASPVWSGDVTKFLVNTSSQLQLNDTQADTAYLSTPNTSISNTEWNLWLKQSFATSANNNGRVYLVSDQADLKGALNGYFVQVGEANDSLALYKQAGITLTKIIPGTIANTNHSTNTLRIKVTRDASGNWKLYSDTLAGFNYLLEGSVNDVTFTSSAFCGVWCKFTVSNDTKFYYDDIYVGPIIVDVTPPAINTLTVVTTTQLDVRFSEGVEQISAQTLSNYSVNNGIGGPSAAVRDGADFSLVHLTFATPFASGVVNTLTVNGVKDFSSNTCSGAHGDFAYYVPHIYDVVINEIMADPDPQVALPDYEYVELFNRKHFPLNLSGWTISVGSTTKVIPDMTLPADSFAVLASTTAAPLLQAFGIAVGVVSFPSVTNTGATIVLRDNNGQMISSVTYSDSWYENATKLEGGWSLEQIDPNNPCGGTENWIASNDVSGGTPGRRNSVLASNPDAVAPFVTGATIISNTHVKLAFSEPEDSASISNPSLYSIDNSIGTPDSVRAVTPDYSVVDIYFSHPLAAEIVYTITVGTTITDCAGNLISTGNSTQFAIYNAKEFDVVFNEIMADPDPPVGLPDFEYVELYNRSDYPINLSGWTLTAGSSSKVISEMTVFPKKFLVLTSTTGALAMKSFPNVAAMSGFPSISNDGSLLILSDTLGRMISMVDYTSNWYNNSGKSDGGWSIEKIDPDNKCGGAENWTASTDPSGGTPGRKNSVFAPNLDQHIPHLVRASCFNPQGIYVYFSEQLDSTTLTNPLNYSVDQGIGNPVSVFLQFPDYSKAFLILSTPLQPGIIYNVSALSLNDCDGHSLSGNSVRVAIPDTAAPLDVILNEILYNPKSGGYDYVEIYNRSQKVIDLKTLRLTSADIVTDSILDIKTIAPEGYLIFPADYLLLTTDPDIVCSQYNCIDAEHANFIDMVSMPAYNIDEDVAAITDANKNIIDKLHYKDKWQFPLLNDTHGVSLERLNFERSTQDSTNWHSAAQSAGFGTPGYKNSEASNGEGDGSEVSLEPEIFSPDEDGHNDVLNIHFHFDTPGYTASVSIYDAKGRPVRALVKNELLGNDGVFSWDGTSDKHEKARIGIYIVFIDAFGLDGKTKHIKKTCVLASKL